MDSAIASAALPADSLSALDAFIAVVSAFPTAPRDPSLYQ